MALTLLPLIAVLAIACGGGNEDISQAAFWEPFRAGGGGLEAEGYATLSDMAESADLVARGRFVAFEDSREVTGDVRQDVVTYGATTFVLDEVIRGQASGDRLVVEFIINERPDRVAEFIATQAANLPEGEIIVFLRAQARPRRIGPVSARQQCGPLDNGERPSPGATGRDPVGRHLVLCG